MIQFIVLAVCFAAVIFLAALSDQEADVASIVLSCKNGYRWIYSQRLDCFVLDCDYVLENINGMEYFFSVGADIEGTYDVVYRYMKEGSSESLITVTYTFHVDDSMHMDYVGKKIAGLENVPDMFIPDPIIE